MNPCLQYAKDALINIADAVVHMIIIGTVATIFGGGLVIVVVLIVSLVA